MYCQHCGKEFKIDENKLAKIEGNEKNKALILDPRVEKAYVCPRCNHIVKSHLNEQDLKELSQASHSEIHRAKNKFSTGMVSLMIGLILTCISFLFLSMAYKATNNYQIVYGVEFYVFVALLTFGVILLAFGITYISIGLYRSNKYQNLLKDIQNDTFVQ